MLTTEVDAARHLFAHIDRVLHDGLRNQLAQTGTVQTPHLRLEQTFRYGKARLIQFDDRVPSGHQGQAGQPQRSREGLGIGVELVEFGSVVRGDVTQLLEDVPQQVDVHRVEQRDLSTIGKLIIYTLSIR